MVPEFSAEEIDHAAVVALEKKGKRTSAYLVHQSITSSSGRAKRAKRIFSSQISPTNSTFKYTPQEVFDLFVWMNLSI